MVLYIIKNGELRYAESNRRPHLSHAVENGRTFIVSDSELYHWKYIKRERKNGRWVYYYDQSDLDNAKKDAAKANNQVNVAIARKNMASKYYIPGVSLYMSPTMKKRKEFYYSADKQLSAARTAAKQYTAKYNKMASSTLVQRTAAKAAVKVANFISSAISKIGSLFKKKKKKK